MALQNNINNSTNISQLDNELLFVQMSPGCINTILLSAGLYQMYSGIEIAHPVYAVLFCNLLVTLISSMIDVFIFPFITILKYTILVNANTTMCFLFHCCSWCVLSLLRCLYIINPKWLHEKFPNPKTLCALAIFGLFFIFILTFGTVLGTSMSFGWPYKRTTDLTSRQRLVSSSTILLTYFSLVGTSCLLYILILRKRGKLGINNVGISERSLKNETLEVGSGDRSNQSKTNLTHCQRTNPRHFIIKKTSEKVTPKIQANKRSLSCTEVCNSIYEDSLRNKIQIRRSKSYEKFNIRHIDTHLELGDSINRVNIQQSADIQECNVQKTRQTDRQTTSIQSQTDRVKFQKAKQTDRQRKVTNGKTDRHTDIQTNIEQSADIQVCNVQKTRQTDRQTTSIQSQTDRVKFQKVKQTDRHRIVTNSYTDRHSDIQTNIVQ
jgi:hypothetical protein